MPDLDFQNISTVQNLGQPKPVTIAAAATINPSTFLTILTGTTQLKTITPPVTGCHMLAIAYSTTSTITFLTTGNISSAIITTGTGQPVLLIYNPLTGTYSGGTLKLS